MRTTRRSPEHGTPRQLEGAFTLLELLLVLVALAIAAGFAMNRYTKTIEGARAETAMHDVRAIRAREEAWRSMNGRRFRTINTNDVAVINQDPRTGGRGNLELHADTSGLYIYTLVGTDATLTITASAGGRPNTGTIISTSTITDLATGATTHAWSGTSPFVPNNSE